MLKCPNSRLAGTNREATKVWWPDKSNNSWEGAEKRQHFYETMHLVKMLHRDAKDNLMHTLELARGDATIHLEMVPSALLQPLLGVALTGEDAFSSAVIAPTCRVHRLPGGTASATPKPPYILLWWVPAVHNHRLGTCFKLYKG